MRQMLRDAGIVETNAPKRVADQWLWDHGFLYYPPNETYGKPAGIPRAKVPENRVEALRKYIGRRRRRK